MSKEIDKLTKFVEFSLISDSGPEPKRALLCKSKFIPFPMLTEYFLD